MEGLAFIAGVIISPRYVPLNVVGNALAVLVIAR